MKLISIYAPFNFFSSLSLSSDISMRKRHNEKSSTFYFYSISLTVFNEKLIEYLSTMWKVNLRNALNFISITIKHFLTVHISQLLKRIKLN